MTIRLKRAYGGSPGVIDTPFCRQYSRVIVCVYFIKLNARSIRECRRYHDDEWEECQCEAQNLSSVNLPLVE